jgi:hypothetical protein
MKNIKKIAQEIISAINTKGIMTSKGKVIFRKDFKIDSRRYIAYIEQDGKVFGAVIDPYNSDQTEWG